jgi:hypothetical protein
MCNAAAFNPGLAPRYVTVTTLQKQLENPLECYIEYELIMEIDSGDLGSKF